MKQLQILIQIQIVIQIIVRKKLHTKKVGHTGTLDPMAKGVLVVAVNKALKLVDDITSLNKEYIAEVQSINHLAEEDSIRAGQTLIVPYYSYDFVK